MPELVIPDNLKSGVTKPNWYEPDVNQTYTEMAEHYGVRFLETSAKVSNNVEQAFTLMTREIKNRVAVVN